MKKGPFRKSFYPSLVSGIFLIGMTMLVFYLFVQSAKGIQMKQVEKVNTAYASVTELDETLEMEKYQEEIGHYQYSLYNESEGLEQFMLSSEAAIKKMTWNLYKFFSVSADGQNFKMNFLPADEYRTRAIWFVDGEIKGNEQLNSADFSGGWYHCEIDAITGNISIISFAKNFSEDVIEERKYAVTEISEKDRELHVRKLCKKWKLLAGNIQNVALLGEASYFPTPAYEYYIEDENRGITIVINVHDLSLASITYDSYGINSTIDEEVRNFTISNQGGRGNVETK